ncbi:MAG: hypothetical protein HYT70_00335 [Candidatus Aenigmarchaeota archaeon]|nr:hypothetical protein [Candidatus Aenigmarchaeota archaeon]
MLKEMGKEIVAPEYVYKETVKEGKEKQLTDAVLIESLFNEAVIKSKKVTERSWQVAKQKLGKELKIGDHSVISLALQINAKELLTDDDDLAKIAETLGIQTISTPDIIFKQLKDKKIESSEFQNLIKDLVTKNRISLKVSEEYLKRGENIENE